MRTPTLLLALSILVLSCSKSSSPAPTPAPDPQPVNNGPLGGTYKFTGSVSRTYDTIPGSGISTMNEYTTTSTNLKGTISITANTITSNGLMYDYTLNGSRKELNTSTGAVVNTTFAPSSGSRGAATTTYKGNYTINTTAGELTIDDAQYLFNPAFTLQPLNNKHSYVLTGSILTVTSVHYNAATKYRSINEASFTKQ